MKIKVTRIIIPYLNALVKQERQLNQWVIHIYYISVGAVGGGPIPGRPPHRCLKPGRLSHQHLGRRDINRGPIGTRLVGVRLRDYVTGQADSIASRQAIQHSPYIISKRDKSHRDGIGSCCRRWQNQP